MVSKSPTNPLVIAAQALFYGLFAVIIAIFSTWPEYAHLEGDRSLIKLSFSYHGEPVGECRERSPEELAKAAELMLDHRGALEIVADGQFVGHPHPAVKLNRVLPGKADRPGHSLSLIHI